MIRKQNMQKSSDQPQETMSFNITNIISFTVQAYMKKPFLFWRRAIKEFLTKKLPYRYQELVHTKFHRKSSMGLSEKSKLLQTHYSNNPQKDTLQQFNMFKKSKKDISRMKLTYFLKRVSLLTRKIIFLPFPFLSILLNLVGPFLLFLLLLFCNFNPKKPKRKSRANQQDKHIIQYPKK